MDILEHLTREHVEIKNKLKELRAAPHEQAAKLLNEISYLVEDVHHHKEEQLLFPAAAQSKMMSQGGPRCTYFMGLRIDENSINRRIISFLELNKIPVKTHTQTKECDELIKSNHALSIPLGEHILGATLMEFMKNHTANENYIAARDLYIELLELHIEKEDECLFEMLKAVIPEKEREDLFKKV